MVLILVYILYDQLSREAKQFDIKQGQRKAWGKGQGVKFLPHSILVNTLESRSFNGF
jgi:hypothetical protein